MSLVDIGEESLIVFDTNVESSSEDELKASERLGVENSETNQTGICDGCTREFHLRRRWIVCVDGTWMDADGAHGSSKGNATNVFRIWAMAKEGIVEDETGKWEQKRKRFIPGVGAVNNVFERLFSGITGRGSTGYETKIKDIYKFCCHEVCAEKDELFMFGFSRGAFIVRAVVGLLFHLKALSHELPNFDQEFIRLLQVYKGAQDKSKEWENRVYEVRSYTKKAPCIRFIGLFDTVKAVNDSNLNDIASFKKVHHVRHALALFEKRKIFHVENFSFGSDIPKNHTIQEAWFAGSHGNIGGSCKQDGLALWPLHWIVTEAVRYGFKIGFKRDDLSNVTDPSKLIFPEDDCTTKTITTKNCIQVDMHNLSSTLERYGFFPEADVRNSLLPFGEKHRSIFLKGSLIGFEEEAPTGLFIHPSVFFLDQTSSPMIEFINKLPYSALLRQQEQYTIPNPSQIFWTIGTELDIRTYAEKPRILVCGQTGAGKSHLINEVLGKTVTPVSKKLNTGKHDVTESLEVEGINLIIHDSKGFDSGRDENYEEVQEFVIKRRAEQRFDQQVHCIWYVVSLDSHRAQATDIRFSELDFDQVPILLVFTNLDGIRMRQRDKVVRDYRKKHKNVGVIQDLGDIPAADRPLEQNRMNELIRQEMMRKQREWNEILHNKFSKTLFTSIREEDRHLLKILIEESHSEMTSERLTYMHQSAQLNFVKNQVDLSIVTLHKIYQSRSRTETMSYSIDGLKDLHDADVRSALSAIGALFYLKGLHPVAFTCIVQGHLWQRLKIPLQRYSWLLSETSSAIFRGFLFLQMLIGWVQVLGRIPDTYFFAALCFSLLSSIIALIERILKIPYISYRHSVLQIRAGIDIILIIERLYWYDRQNISELSVRCACLYYLKLRPQVHARLEQKISWYWNLPTKRRATRVLKDLFEEFKYKRQVRDGS